MNRRSRPIASEQAEVAKRDQNVSLGDVEETETSLWLHIYPAAVQRQALLTLMPALGCSDTALRRDECGDPVIAGMSRLTARLERLEAVLKPSGRAFVLVWRRTDPSPRRRRNTGPSTVLDCTTRSSRLSERRGTERGTASHAQ
jgi:hypothetical protein